MSPAPKTAEEKQLLIANMKKKVSAYVQDEYWLSDNYLYKWIEDKAYNVDKAEKALRKSLKWRLENKIDDILNEDYGDLHDQMVYYTDGFDKEGRIVVTIPCNLFNIKTGLQEGNKDRLLGFFRQMTEITADRVRTACLKNSNSPSTFVTIIDFDGIDMTKATPDVVNFCVSTATSVEDNYPGCAEATYIINASKGVKKTYAFAKTALRRNTVERIKMFSNNRHKWEPVILEVINADQIRPRFGGTKPDDSSPTQIEEIHSNLEELKIKD